jgi:7-cyano-7-deazaguanine tRNA-ribosyltransferase
MESYEYKLLANMILVAKKQMPDSIPLHLFGAGHPMTIPLAVALGCDTFDSASYILYARKGRYIMDDVTTRLEEISYFSCSCEVCSKYTPKEVLALEFEDRTNKVALHNLFAIKAEVNRVKEAIHEGRLWEYVHKKARSHPKLFESINVFTENPRFFADRTPRFKEKAIFLFSKEDQFRPEVALFHQLVRKFKCKKDILVIIPDGTVRPFYLSKEYNDIKKQFLKKYDRVQFCQFNPFLGIIPLEISDMYPASHYVMPRIRYNQNEFPEFTKTWRTFFVNNNFKIVYAASDEFLKYHTKLLPRKIKVISISR